MNFNTTLLAIYTTFMSITYYMSPVTNTVYNRLELISADTLIIIIKQMDLAR